MSYAFSIRLMADTLRTLEYCAISGTYMGIGTGFTKPIRLLYVQNLTDVILVFSLDGINDHFPLVRDGYMILDITTNKSRDGGWFIAEGQRLYVKTYNLTPICDPGSMATSPSSGAVCVSAFYGSEGA